MQSDRAKQFLPFESLKGFKEMLLLAEIPKESKKDLLEDECNILNTIILKLKKDMNVTISYYYEVEYVKTTGIIKKIDFIHKKVYLLDGIINFDDIVYIQIN